MEHAEAFETNAPDRYLLGQLSAAEADAFEEHYFDCTTCAEEVRLGMSFLEAGRRLVRETREPAAPVPAVPVVAIESDPRRRRGFRWIPAAAVAATLALAGNVAVLMRMQSAVPKLGLIADNPDVLFVGETRNAESKPQMLKIPQGATGLLPIEVPPQDPPYPRYEARVLRGDEVLHTYPVDPALLAETVKIPLPDPGPGTYGLVIVGIRPAGENEIVRHTFVVTR